MDQRALVKVKEAIRLKENLHEVIAWQHSRPSVESACSMQSAEPSPERKSRRGCTTPSRDLLVRSAAPAGAMGTVVGFVYSGLDLGSAMTPPFLGFLLDHHHPRLIFIFTAGILLLAICTAFMVGRNDTRRARTAPVARHLRLRRTKPNYARA